MSLPQNGGTFYVNTGLETVVDPSNVVVQNQLLEELRKCEDLVHLDQRYARLVAGASKMPLSMIWVARNQDETVSDTDLAAFKDLAWNEFIKKRYLPAVPSSATVGESAASMLEIVREMNLQRRRFQIMGLHEQVEASEIQLVLHLCQVGILHTDRYRAMANRFRRHDKLYEAFALAVGAFVCASAPMTLGAVTTRNERSLQCTYRNELTALFIIALKKNPGNTAVALEEDYVARIERLIVVWPERSVGARDERPVERANDGSIATAQIWADQARTESTRLRERLEASERTRVVQADALRNELKLEIADKLSKEKEVFDAKIQNSHVRIDLKIDTETEKVKKMVETSSTKITQLENMLNAARPASNAQMPADWPKLVNDEVTKLEPAIVNHTIAAVDAKIAQTITNIAPAIVTDVENRVTAAIDLKLDRMVNARVPITDMQQVDTMVQTKITTLGRALGTDTDNKLIQFNTQFIVPLEKGITRIQDRLTENETNMETMNATITQLKAKIDLMDNDDETGSDDSSHDGSILDTVEALAKMIHQIQDTFDTRIQIECRDLVRTAVVAEVGSMVASLQRPTAAQPGTLEDRIHKLEQATWTVEQGADLYADIAAPLNCQFKI